MFMRSLALILLSVQMATHAHAQEALRATPADSEMKSVLEGAVLNELSKQPLEGVKVELFPMDEASGDPKWDAAAYSAVTDIAGRFRIDNAKPGKYEITCGKKGFIPGRAVPGAVSGPESVTLAAGETHGGLSYTLAPAAVVSGRVLDEDGKPVRKASVALPMPFGPDNGKRGMILHLAKVATNQAGEYRLDSLWPGAYYIEATPPAGAVGAGAAAAKPPSDAPRRAWVTTYYPNASDPAQAMPIKVSAGQELVGQDIVLRKEKVVTVSGHVLANDGSPAQRVSLNLAPRYLVGSSCATDTDSQGAFAFVDLQPGDYLLLVIDKSTDDDGRITYIQLPVGDSDQHNVTLRMQTLEASGAFVLEGSDRKDVDYADCHIQAMPSASDLLGVVNGTVKRDGTFRLARLMAGNVTLNARCPAAGPSYIQSILVSGADVMGTEIDSADLAASGIKVVLRNDAASVGGTLDIASERRAALKRPVAVLVPTDARLRRTGILGISAIDASNHFQHTGVRPGEYLAFAFEEANSSTFEDPRFYTLIQSKGERVTLAPGESKTLSLKLLPWPAEFSDRIHP